MWNFGVIWDENKKISTDLVKFCDIIISKFPYGNLLNLV